MCHPGASSQLVKEYQRIGWTVIDTSRQVRLSEIIDYTTVEKVIVAGGEPTIMPEFQTFLTRALEHERSDIELMIITNATNVNPRVFELLSQFTNVQFTVSIDGYDQVNRYIRWPSDWVTLTRNIHRLRTITEQVCFSVCASIWNISNLSQLVKFLDTEYNVPVILFNEAMNPRDDAEVSPFLFPNKELALADLELCKQSKNYEIDDLEMLGVGTAAKGDNRTYFIVCNSDKLDAVRTRFGLGNQDFHTTLGFKDKDVFGVPKNKIIEK
jgi:sulfatase maturation enzyme AslB (radical SAM superfamily)